MVNWVMLVSLCAETTNPGKNLTAVGKMHQVSGNSDRVCKCVGPGFEQEGVGGGGRAGHLILEGDRSDGFGRNAPVYHVHPALLIYVVHLLKSRACTEPRHTAARRGKVPPVYE